MSRVEAYPKRSEKAITFQITMSLARQMLRDGTISRAQYRAFYRKMVDQYHPSAGTLLADIDLT